VPPPRTVKVVKGCIATVENIKDREMTSLFLTPFSKSLMNDADKFTILNGTGPGSTPQEPLALVAKMSDSERSALESDGRGGLQVVNAAELDTTHVDNRYVYYILYVVDYPIPSKVAINPEEPSLGCIRLDSIAPPHSPTFIKRCISRVEKNPSLAWRADLFADTSCDSPLEEGHISLLRTDGPGLSPNEPMAIVVKNPSIPDGKYLIKNRAADLFWNAYQNPIKTVCFYRTTIEEAMKYKNTQWDIKQDTNGNISITSPYAPSQWVGAKMKGSRVPVPWRFIPSDTSESYYLTMDMNRFSQNPRVPAAKLDMDLNSPGSMATLNEGDQWQMWEFIRI